MNKRKVEKEIKENGLYKAVDKDGTEWIIEQHIIFKNDKLKIDKELELNNELLQEIEGDYKPSTDRLGLQVCRNDLRLREWQLTFFKNDDCFVCINADYLSFFSEKAKIEIIDEQKPIRIKEGKLVKGYIMPIYNSCINAAYYNWMGKISHKKQREMKKFFGEKIKMEEKFTLLEYSLDKLFDYADACSNEYQMSLGIAEEYRASAESTKKFLNERYGIEDARDFVTFFKGYMFSRERNI